MKAIETIYRGYRFRSRLEARWAVYLDALKLRWEYEPEGIDLGGMWYLPDFRIASYDGSGQATWIEIKGREPTKDEVSKASNLAQQSGCPVLLFGNTFDDLCPLALWFEPGTGRMVSNMAFAICPHCTGLGLAIMLDHNGGLLVCQCMPSGQCLDWDDFTAVIAAEELLQARNKARQARFEHREID